MYSTRESTENSLIKSSHDGTGLPTVLLIAFVLHNKRMQNKQLYKHFKYKPIKPTYSNRKFN